MNCCLSPAGIDAVSGDTTMDCSTPVLRVAIPVMPPLVALIVVEPAPTAVTMPEVVMVATDMLDDAHETEVNVFRDPSEYLPLAVYCWDVPTGIKSVCGATVIETNTGAVTLSAAVPFVLFKLAVMVAGVELIASPVAKPVALTLAVRPGMAVQATVSVTLPVVPSP